MKRLWVLGLSVVLAAPWASAGQYVFNPAFDVGNSDAMSEEWSFICEVGAYQAWLGFDVSAIPDRATLVRATLQAYMFDSLQSDRSCWYEPDDAWITAMTNPRNKAVPELIGTVRQLATNQWYTFTLDLSLHDWQSDLLDNRVSLMVTGCPNLEHVCGKVYLSESVDYVPVLTIETEDVVVPAPGALLLAGIGSGLVGWRRRRKAR